MKTDWDGTLYDRFSKAQFAWGLEMLAAIPLRGSERVLDIGCGTGRLTARICERVPFGSVVGLDRSASMLRAAAGRRRFNMTLLRRDAARMDFDGEFDLVFSNAALHWVRDHEALQAAIFRALRPDGRCRLQFAARGNCPRSLTVLRELLREPPWREDFQARPWPWSMPGTGDCRRMMERFPYADLEVWEERIAWDFGSESEMHGWAESTLLVPFLRVLGGRRREQFAAEAKRRLGEALRDRHGRWRETFVRLNAAARRPARIPRPLRNGLPDLP